MFEKNMMFYLCKMQQNNLLQQKLQSNLQDKKLLFANVKAVKIAYWSYMLYFILSSKYVKN